MKNICILALTIVAACSPVAEKPNILLILADDMGYSDISSFGGEIQTPCLDRLADKGIRFTQFYNTARCCPTRASLLTGLYPHETGVGHLTGRSMGAGYMGYLNDSIVTLAEVMKAAGYYTALAGKWHVGNNREAWPDQRGFDHYYGIHNYVDSYFKVLDNCEVFEDGKMVIAATLYPSEDTITSNEWYTTDVFTDKAMLYMGEALDQGQPFFQYLAFNAPHWPLEAHDSYIERHLNDYQEGYEELRRIKFERMKKMGLLKPAWQLPGQETPPWDELSDSAKLDTRFRRAIYAAQIEIMDHNIGRIVQFLEDRGALDNTVIFFLSDNGCSAEPENSMFGYSWGEATRWNYQNWRRNSARAGASQGMAWAITSNVPFRYYKKFIHEGGISTPLIVHWPKGIKNPGTLNEKPGHLVDIMSTCIDLTQASFPAERNGVPVKSLRGISLLPDLKGGASKPHAAIFWEHEGHGGLRMGNWKLVSVNPKDTMAWELYDLEKDRSETNDLSSQFPDICDQMISEWIRLAFETNALPWPDKSKAVAAPFDK